MPRCPKKCPSGSGQLRPALMPRLVLSSVQLSCSCSSLRVCTQDTCANSASCLLSSPGTGPEFCPHGLAPADEDCMGPCHNPPAPPPPCPVCAQHLAEAPSFELDTSKPYQPTTQQPFNQPAQGPGYRNFQSPVQPMPYQTGPNPAYQPQTQPYNQLGTNPCCDSPFPPQMQPAQSCNQHGQVPACDTAFQSPPQPYHQPNQTSQENPSTNANGCSMSCGTLKKNIASNVDSGQPKEPKNCCSQPEPKDGSDQPENEKSSCCTSGSGIQTGPHIGPGKRIDSAISSSKRRPSLVHIQKAKEPRLSLQEPLDKNPKKSNLQIQPAPPYNQPGQNPACRTPFQASTQPHRQPTLTPEQENQSTNTSANGSYCSNSCGTLKRQSARYFDGDQPKSMNSSRWQGPENKSSWCKSGSGIPHAGFTNNGTNGSQCSIRRSSLKKISVTNVDNDQPKSKNLSSCYKSGRDLHTGSSNTSAKGSRYSSRCGSLKKNSASNVDDDQSKFKNSSRWQGPEKKSSWCKSGRGTHTGSTYSSANGSQCSVPCGTLRKNFATNVDKNQSKSKKNSSKSHEPERKGSWYKNGKGSTNTSANGSQCSIRCGTLRKISATNVDNDQTKSKKNSSRRPEKKSSWYKSGRGIHAGSTNNSANGSQCSIRCGTLRKISATNDDNEQLKSKNNSNRDHEPEEKSSWYKSVRGIHTGSTNNSANGSQCSIRCGTLKKNSATNVDNDQLKSKKNSNRGHEPEEKSNWYNSGRGSTNTSANGSQCSMRCGTLKENSATNIHKNQSKSKKISSKSHEPDEKSSWYKSGRGTHTGSARSSANGSQCSIRCGSLKKKSATTGQSKSKNSRRRYEPEEKANYNSANGSQCSIRCSTLMKNSATNVNNDQLQSKKKSKRNNDPEEKSSWYKSGRGSTNPSANGSQCSIRCGTLMKNSATYVSNDQLQSMKNSNRRHGPEKKSNWYKGGLHKGPHMGPGQSDNGGLSSAKRRPSLVHIQKGKELRLSLQDLDTHSKKKCPGAGCQQGAGLFPTPAAPCACRMPPALGGCCTGNLSGTCACDDCNKK